MLIYNTKKMVSRIRHLLQPFAWRIRSLFSAEVENPIIVLGNQKTGTTVIAALIGQASGKQVTLDFMHLYPTLTDRLLSGELSFTDMRRKCRYHMNQQILKEPGLTLFCDDLCLAYPRSKIVLILRDPRENIRSILNRLKLRGDWEQIPEEEMCRLRMTVAPEWLMVLEGDRFGHAGKNYVDSLARRCAICFNYALANRERFHIVRYEDFKEDKKNFIEGLCLELELDVSGDIQGLVDVQYQPKGASVDHLQFFGEENLACIDAACLKYYKEFDYAE